jgi:N-acetyl-anhydromuramyl-L-alanine amidase AmpD
MSADSHRLKNKLLINNADSIAKLIPAFKNPAVRLRFIQSVSELGNKHEESIRNNLTDYPKPLQKFVLRWVFNLKVQDTIYEFLQNDPTLSQQEKKRFLRKVKVSSFGRFILKRYEKKQLRVFLLSSIACLVLCSFAVGFGAISLGRHLVAMRRANQSAAKQTNKQNGNTNLPDLPNSTEKVWLVEKQSDNERYSNGLRILTIHQTTNRTRKFQIYDRNLEKPVTDFIDKPIGVLYHSTESDLVDFVPTNTDSIEAISKDILNFIKTNESYNYFVDRFGQVYRIVQEEDVAYHAGRSVWADERGIIVELNESFIGVSFETRSADTNESQLTEAQLISGRLLTGMLRSRYNIADVNCVTHGLASVNPDNGVIAYHYDWLQGFPFKAIGLTDKYEQPPPSIAELGFIYDGGTVKILGGGLSAVPGLPKAAAAFKQRAIKENTTPENLRLLLRERCLNIMNKMREPYKDKE